MIEGFGRAYAKGYYACTLDPEKCLRAFWRFDPASKPAADKEAEWIETNLPALMVDINKAMTGIDESKMGAINPECIEQELVAALKAGEVIPTDQIDVSHLYTNSFVPKINDLLPPSGGQVLLGGQPVRKPRPDVGIVFQQATLLPWKTVFENVMVPVRALGRRVGACHDKAEELLRLVGLQDFRAHYPRELSGGMQQRVAVARGLIHDPGPALDG